MKTLARFYNVTRDLIAGAIMLAACLILAAWDAVVLGKQEEPL